MNAVSFVPDSLSNARWAGVVERLLSQLEQEAILSKQRLSLWELAALIAGYIAPLAEYATPEQKGRTREVFEEILCATQAASEDPDEQILLLAAIFEALFKDALAPVCARMYHQRRAT